VTGPSAGLTVGRLTVRFGGLVAVDDLSFEVPTGRLTGLIGPNGAGKTTTFNACSGLVRPAAGTVRFGDRDITDLAPPTRARLGLGRTFQRIALFDRLTVAENVAIGREARLSGTRLLGQLVSTAQERATVQAATAEAVELCGLGDHRHRRAGTLSTGQRRLVELARALAGGFDVLLLDEPSSGLDLAETAQMGEILRIVTRERGTGVLLVEHDMSLVASVCEYIYVLDFGRLIEDGAVDEVLRSEKVRAAYLGDEEVA
jgi:ABC-type branched-subunit amino acid transport system ATPase component